MDESNELHTYLSGNLTRRLTGGRSPSLLNLLCTPGMGVNLWGASPLYVNPVNVLNILTKVLLCLLWVRPSYYAEYIL